MKRSNEADIAKEVQPVEETEQAHGIETNPASSSVTLACDLCPDNQKFSSKKDWVEHRLATHMNLIISNPNCCVFCTMEFSETAILDDHVRDHLGEVPFMCSTCGKSYSSRQSLREHIKTHKRKRKQAYREMNAFKRVTRNRKGTRKSEENKK